MKAKQNGKGSKRRPTDEIAYRDNYDGIFVPTSVKSGNIFGDPLSVELRPYDADPIEHVDSWKKSNPSFGAGSFIVAASAFSKLFK